MRRANLSQPHGLVRGNLRGTLRGINYYPPSQVGGEAVALRAIKQTALMSLGVHYEIMLRNDCLRTDEEQLALINKHSPLGRF